MLPIPRSWATAPAPAQPKTEASLTEEVAQTLGRGPWAQQGLSFCTETWGLRECLQTKRETPLRPSHSITLPHEYKCSLSMSPYIRQSLQIVCSLDRCCPGISVSHIQGVFLVYVNNLIIGISCFFFGLPLGFGCTHHPVASWEKSPQEAILLKASMTKKAFILPSHLRGLLGGEACQL